MIKKVQAELNVLDHQKRKPWKNIATISEAIRVSSLLGHSNITIFVHKKDERRIKDTLKKNGYILTTVYAQSIPDELLLTIDWTTSDFIGHYSMEVSDE